MINLPTLAFMKRALGPGADPCVGALCFAIESSSTGFVRERGTELGKVANCAKLCACMLPGIFE